MGRAVWLEEQVGMIHLVASFWGHSVWHPLHGDGYQFWSGIGGMVLDFLAKLIALLIILWRLSKHFQCHEETCHLLGTHRVQGTPYRTCWQHHPVLSQCAHRSVPIHLIRRSHSEALDGAIKVKEGNS